MPESPEEPRRAQPFQAPKGTQDILPPDSDRWQALIARFAEHVGRAGYGLLQSPMFEEMGVFSRVGEGTDVVRKEMYDFLDKGGRHIALRPEGTASVVRAYVQHRPPTPWKVWYAAPSFRYERAQANRFRQHHQLGAEALGPADPDLDVEIVAMLHDFYRSLGLRQVDLVINSIGTPTDRTHYIDRLRSFLVGRIADLDPEDQEKVEAHPMRVLDSKRAASQAVVADAPLLLESLSPDAAAHFERVQRGLDAVGIGFRIEPRLVRGLDYYTHTAFEFQSAADRRGPEHHRWRWALRRPGRVAGRSAHPGHRLRYRHRADPRHLRCRGRVRRTGPSGRGVRGRRHRRRDRP